jgi:hypothetical protein
VHQVGFSLHDDIKMHSQQNIKKKKKMLTILGYDNDKTTLNNQI